MLDKLSKSALVYMNNQSRKPSATYYNFGEDLSDMAHKLSVDVETMRTAIRYLEEHKYIKYVRNGDNKPLRFYLDHQGLHWKEFRRQEIIKYLEDNWIDFLAMLVALLSLGISLSNAFGLLPST